MSRVCGPTDDSSILASDTVRRFRQAEYMELRTGKGAAGIEYEYSRHMQFEAGFPLFWVMESGGILRTTFDHGQQSSDQAHIGCESG